MGKKGFGVLLAVVAIAVLPVASASATELCSTEGSPCSGTKYGSGTSFEAPLVSGTGFIIDNSIATIVCTAATLKGKTSSSGGSGSSIRAEITSILVYPCKLGTGSECSATATLNLAWPASFTGAGSVFSLKIEDSAGVAFYFLCRPYIDCTFSTKLATLEGSTEVPGDPRFLAVQTLSGSGKFCPATAQLTAVWQISKPLPLYIV